MLFVLSLNLTATLSYKITLHPKILRLPDM